MVFSYKMKILTWNINGIRASKVELKQLFNSLDADIICLQETKVTRDMLDEPTAIVEGYNCYFSFSKKRSGYSGVATFCKDTCSPEKAEEGLTGLIAREGGIGCYGDKSNFTTEELESLDAEGRALLTQHQIRLPDGEVKDMVVINVYCPRADPEREDRLVYKLRFFAMLQTRAEALVKDGRYVVVLGDMNVSHRKIDNCDPCDENYYTRPSRVWLNQLLQEYDRDPEIAPVEDKEMFPATTPEVIGGMFVDTFRYCNPEKTGAYTCWCTLTSARQTNYGNRIDYILINQDFVKTCLTNSVVMSEVEGSDHCPVKVYITCSNINPTKLPPLCTQFMPEFTGKQQKLSSFFTKLRKEDSVHGNSSQENSSVEEEKLCIQQEKMTEIVSAEKLKRSGSLMQIPDSKRQKLGKKTSSNENTGRQACLMNFFTKTNKDVKPIDSHNEDRSDVDKKASSYVKKDTAPVNRNGQKKSQESDSCKSKPQTTVAAWKNLLGGLPPPPLCKGHKEPCVLRSVKKDGPNHGKQFYTCARPEGHSSNHEARCDFFKWLEKKKFN